MRKGDVVGVIFVAKKVPQPFTAKQIELVTTFADQALIAIENVRLFDEVQARTRELSQSVEELRALGEVWPAPARNAGNAGRGGPGVCALPKNRSPRRKCAMWRSMCPQS